MLREHGRLSAGTWGDRCACEAVETINEKVEQKQEKCKSLVLAEILLAIEGDGESAQLHKAEKSSPTIAWIRPDMNVHEFDDWTYDDPSLLLTSIHRRDAKTMQLSAVSDARRMPQSSGLALQCRSWRASRNMDSTMMPLTRRVVSPA